MKSENEILREMLLEYANGANRGAAGGEHLRDEDFIRLIEAFSSSKTGGGIADTDGRSPAAASPHKLSAIRAHLADCAACLAEFKDFYAFFAPAETGEAIAGKNELEAAWQAFVPRIKEKRQRTKFWAWWSGETNSNHFGALGWGLAAILLLLTGIGFFALRQARDENNRLAEQIETQRQQLESEKQTFEERLNTLEESGRNSELAEQEKTRLEEEKNGLQNRIAALETEIERTKQRRTTGGIDSPRNSQAPPREKADNSLVAVNTPIYDVFPADAARRGSGGQPSNNLIVPAAAKNVVLILNAAGLADYPAYQVELLNSAGKIIWRGAGLKKDNLGSFTLTLSRAALRAGNYRLRLSGAGKSTSPQAIAEYNLTIEIK